MSKKEKSSSTMLNSNLFIKAVVIPIIFSVLILMVGFLLPSHNLNILPNGSRAEMANSVQSGDAQTNSAATEVEQE